MDVALPALEPSRELALAPLRIMLTYVWRHGRMPDLARPARFTELVQHRKLHDRDGRIAPLVDKIRVKTFVTAALGEAWVTPTLWHGGDLPDAPVWPRPFVVKARHGCNQIAFVREESVDWQAIRVRARRWMRKEYGGWLDEWGYRHVPRGLLIEPFIGAGPGLPIDYKFYVFGGRVAFVQVHLERGGRHRWIVMNPDWRRVSSPTRDADPPRPAALTEMIAAAERLGRGFDFVRVDLYDVGGTPRFGEMTFYPGSGLDRFDPVSLDQVMGDHWLRARDAGTLPPPTAQESPRWECSTDCSARSPETSTSRTSPRRSGSAPNRSSRR